VAKQRQTKMQYQLGSLGVIPDLEDRTDEQLLSESKHRAAAKAILGARAAERYESEQARKYFNEALAACHPQERPMLRQMMKAALAQAERRPDDLRDAMEKLGQTPPSGRQLALLRLMGLIAPPPNASLLLRLRGFGILILLVLAIVAIGFGLAKLIALPFGGVGTFGGILLGLLIVVAVLGALAFFGRRRQERARARAVEEAAETRARLRR
jgi:hypothetical protein